MEGNKKGPQMGLSDEERFPLLKDLRLLNALRQDELAPKFNFMSGDRLNASQLKKVQDYAFTIRRKPVFWDANEQPVWIDKFLDDCKMNVPFYINRKGGLHDQPTINRNHIRKQPWSFVAEKADLDELLVYQTSGTTGAALDVLFDPVSQACWLPQMQSLLDAYGISLGSRKVAIALICAQASTLTYASLSAYLNGAGILKLNLNPADWEDASHRVQYLEKYDPEILTGDPFAFMALLQLHPRISPKALISSAMKLSDGIRKELEAYFNVPVLDVYSLTECRNVAVARGERYKAIRPELYLEIFHPHSDVLLPYGEKGELVITGGNNPFLPLIRYRTGDFCRLSVEDGIPWLYDLEARKLVKFYSSSRTLVNTIDISREMNGYTLAGFKLHQKADLSLTFEGWSNDDIADPVLADLLRIFGPVPVRMMIHKITDDSSSKAVSYSSDH